MKKTTMLRISIVIVSVLLFGFLTLTIFKDTPVISLPQEKKTISYDGIYSGIEIGSSGAKFSIVELEKNTQGKPTYVIKDEGNTDYKFNFIENSSIKSEKISDLEDQLRNHFSKVKEYFEASDLPMDINNFYIALSNDYLETKNNDQLFLPFIKSELENFNIEDNLDYLDTKQEGKSNFLTTICSREFILNSQNFLDIDIGTNSIKFTTYEEGNPKSYTKLLLDKEEGRIGKDYIHKLVKEKVGDFNVYKSSDREKVVKTINLLNDDIDAFLSDFSSFKTKPNIVLTGGIPFDVFKLTYGKKMNNNNQNFIEVNFQKAYESLLSNILDKSISLRYIDKEGNEEIEDKGKIFIRLVFLNILKGKMDPTGEKPFFFYQRKSWLPGYVIHKKVYN